MWIKTKILEVIFNFWRWITNLKSNRHVYMTDEEGALLNKKLGKVLAPNDSWKVAPLDIHVKLDKINCKQNFLPECIFSISHGSENKKFTAQKNFSTLVQHDNGCYNLKILDIQRNPSQVTFELLKK